MKKFFLILFYTLIICTMAVIVTVSIIGCKPSMPTKEDFKDSDGAIILPCYMAAVIAVTNTYTETKTPIDDSITKCYRYTDYDKCKKENDPEECWSKVGIRK